MHLNYETIHIKSGGRSTTSVHADLEFYVRARTCEKTRKWKAAFTSRLALF